MQGKKILIIDDDSHLCQVVKTLFVRAGAEVYTAMDGRRGLQQFYANQPDLVLLDIRMPDLNGWEICRHIRMVSPAPVIMLTTLHQDHEIVQGLQCGADDFVTKPFNGDVLMARADTVLRRVQYASKPLQSVAYDDGYLTIDLEKRQVLVDNKMVRLTVTEFDLLAYLYRHAGQSLTYQTLLHQIWGSESTHNLEYIHVYVSNLRKKLEKDPRHPQYFMTEHGVGYRFFKQPLAPGARPSSIAMLSPALSN